MTVEESPAAVKIAVVVGNPKAQSRTLGVALAVADALADGVAGPTERLVVDLAVEIGRDGREGKPVGTMFVVGNHRKVLQMSHEQVHDPFKGYNQRERMIRNPRVRESIKEIAQLDGAFIVSADGIVCAAGRNIDAPAEGLTLSKGLGSRHWAAAAISVLRVLMAVMATSETPTTSESPRFTPVHSTPRRAVSWWRSSAPAT